MTIYIVHCCNICCWLCPVVDLFSLLSLFPLPLSLSLFLSLRTSKQCNTRKLSSSEYRSLFSFERFVWFLSQLFLLFDAFSCFGLFSFGSVILSEKYKKDNKHPLSTGCWWVCVYVCIWAFLRPIHVGQFFINDHCRSFLVGRSAGLCKQMDGLSVLFREEQVILVGTGVDALMRWLSMADLRNVNL